MIAAVTVLACLCAAQFVVLTWLWWRFADAAYLYAKCSAQRKALSMRLDREHCQQALRALGYSDEEIERDIG